MNTTFDGRLYELKITCGPNYPIEPPKIKFASKINLPYVNQNTGVVESNLPAFTSWSRNNTIESVLVSIRTLMNSPQNKRLPQPPEGTYF